MYLELNNGEGILSEDNIWYEGDTSTIYKQEDLLYKIYLKKEPHKRHILDILIDNTSLREIGALPIQKIKVDNGYYGMVMRYIPNTRPFLKYSRSKNDVNDLINMFIVLSENLKKIHLENIKFSDLHHNNILLTQNLKPYFIDFDDAIVGEYSSQHICCMCHFLHELEGKDYDFISHVIKDMNLDREALIIMFINTLLGLEIEKLSEVEYYKLIDSLSKNFPNDFIKILEQLKKNALLDIPFEYYLGDYLVQEEVKEGCKILRRNQYEYNSFKSN